MSTDTPEAMTWCARTRYLWLVVVVFAIGMAWVESACVYYLRLLVDRIEPYQVNPLPIRSAIGGVELMREAATLVMLATVGMLAGRTARLRAAYTAIAFGVWDIFYYLFLRLMSGWPRSLLDWDILFLIPLPWWGPVIAPVAIACLMIVGGTLIIQSGDPAAGTVLTRALWRLQAIGIALALYVFMADALAALARAEDVTSTLPQQFDWPLFLVAFALMAAPVAHTGWQVRSRPPRRPVAAGAPAVH